MKTLITSKNALIFTLCLFSGILNAANWFVKGDGNSNVTGGSTWATAVTLTKAAGSAGAGDFIYLAKGTYIPTAVTSLSKAYTVVGGFNGDENEATITPSMSNPALYPTTFTVVGAQTFRAFNLGSSTNTGTLILSGINIDGFISSQNGNAIECNSSSVLDVEINNCSFKNISSSGATVSGAININNVSANVTIKDSKFENIASGNNGGAISTNAKSTNTITIQNCTFKNTYTPTSSTVYNGGAIYANSTGYTLNIKDCTFEDTKASTGGAIYLSTLLTANISNCNFVRCTTQHPTAGTGHGGAINFMAPILNITGCKFDNCSDNGRGLIYWNAASTKANIKKSIFINNTSSGTTQNSGAVFGIQNASSNVKIDSCYAYNNTSTANTSSMSASVLYSAAGKSNITVENSVFVKNIGKGTNTRAISYPAGLTTADTIVIKNSIVMANSNLATNDTLRDVMSPNDNNRIEITNSLLNNKYLSTANNTLRFDGKYPNFLSEAEVSTITTKTTITDVVAAANILLGNYVTSLPEGNKTMVQSYSKNGKVYLMNLATGTKLSVYNNLGQLIHSASVNSGQYNFDAKNMIIMMITNAGNTQKLKMAVQ